jgi:Leucine-rich repeat (LRR) protein
MKQILLMIALVAVVALVGCGKKSPTVEIANPIVEKAIREELFKPKGKLTKADLEKVTWLSLALNQLTEVPKGLENLTQLTRLGLGGNQLTEVEGLEKLTKLAWLYLNPNQLTDVKGLVKLTQLTFLNLSENQLTDVTGLEKLTNLQELYLNDNQLSNVKGLEKLTQLWKLNLYNNPALTKAQIDQLQKALSECFILSNPPLNAGESAKVIEAAIRKAAKKPTGELTKADYEKVARLNLNDNKLANVKGLEKLTKLERLLLIGNQLTSVKGLEKLTQLESLGLTGNQLTDVKGLENLTQLKTLHLTNNPDLTKAQIAELQKALPKCKIWSNPKK